MEVASVLENYFKCDAQRYRQKKKKFILVFHCIFGSIISQVWSRVEEALEVAGGKAEHSAAPPEDVSSLCFSPRCAQFAVLKEYAWKILLCALLSGRTVAVLSLAICHFSSRLRNCSDLEIFLRFFLHPLQSKITDLCLNKSLLEIFREKKE